MAPPSGTFDNDWAEAKPSVMFRRLSASRRYNQGELREEAVTNCHIDLTVSFGNIKEKTCFMSS